MILVLTNHSRDGALITGRVYSEVYTAAQAYRTIRNAVELDQRQKYGRPKPAMVAIRAVSRDGATATGYEVGKDGATIGGEVESRGGTHQIGVANDQC